MKSRSSTPLAELVDVSENAAPDSRYPTPSTMIRADTESRDRPALSNGGGGGKEGEQRNELMSRKRIDRGFGWEWATAWRIDSSVEVCGVREKGVLYAFTPRE